MKQYFETFLAALTADKTPMSTEDFGAYHAASKVMESKIMPRREFEIRQEAQAELAASLGIEFEGKTYEQTFGLPVAKPRPRTLYINPANSGETWNGRGDAPAWFSAAVAAGVQPDLMLKKKD